jgi:hypothetical protein
MPAEDKPEFARPLYGLTPMPGFESLRLGSLHGFPALWQHIECQRVTVGVLIAFQYGHWRQHMPDAIIVEDVTLTRFAHREAIHFLLVIVGHDDFATLSAAAAH